MKTRNKIAWIALLCLCCLTFALVSCGGDDGPDKKSETGISVTATCGDSLDLSDTEALSYDYVSLFVITENGKTIPTLAEYVDSSAVKAETGTYQVWCRYKNFQRTITVNVTAIERTLTISQDSITLLVSQVDGFDFNALFTVTSDGEGVEITPGMVVSDVKALPGVYSYTVSFGGISKTLTVTVSSNILIVKSFNEKTLEIGEVESYDYTMLFSIYDKGKAVRVTPAMLTFEGRDGVKVGGTFKVKIAYSSDGIDERSEVTVRVVADAEYAVEAKNIVTYLHAGTIDLKALFTVTRGGQSIEVTPDMIDGEIDYSKAGVNEITLSIGGREYTATVEIKDGVVLSGAHGDTVYIKRGLEKDSYPFVLDFEVTIDGVRFYSVPDSYLIGIDAVDFDTIGEYEVTLKIPYNMRPPSWSGAVNFTYAEKTINYVVVERVGSARVKSETVVLPSGTRGYSVFDNLDVVVDGVKQALTDNKSLAGRLATYAEVLSEPLNFGSNEPQKVEIAVYVNGVDAEPTVLSYSVEVKSNVEITPISKGVFSGETVFARDLFTITENGQSVDIGKAVISGKADTFVPGVYDIKCEYKGAEATATVTVFDSGMKGTFKTSMTTVPPAADDDSDVDDGYYTDGEDYSAYAFAPNISASAAEVSAATAIGDLVISADGSITVNGSTAQVIGGIDESTLLVRVGTNNYTLYYENGIVVLDPDNSLKLGFNDYKRPLVFFNDAMWKIEHSVTVNYGDNYVLSTTYTSYSMDTFKLSSKTGGDGMWYALYVRLAEKTSNDTVYVVKWGEAVLPDDFEPAKGVQSSITFDGETYRFEMRDATTAKVVRNDDIRTVFAGKTFNGELNGTRAKLICGQSGTFEFLVDNSRVFYLASYELNNSKNWYADESTGRLFLYRYEDDEPKFSYTFELNTQDNTFTIIDKDAYYGKYVSGDTYIYLDGYGTGFIDFGTKYVETQIRYAVHGGVVSIEYVNTSSSFEYGTNAEFYIGEFLNTLTVKRADANVFDGKILENKMMYDGAIVNISRYSFGAIGDTLGRAQLYSAISIKTSAGELNAEQKQACIDLSTVSFNTPGFYRYAIKLSVGGTVTPAYYTIQIVKYGENLDGNSSVKAYGLGSLIGRSTLTLDVYGNATLGCGSVIYNGYVTASSNGNMTIKAYSDKGGAVYATVSAFADGIIRLDCKGAENFTELYTTGTSRVVGATGVALREFTVGGNKTYMLSSSTGIIGEIVEFAVVEGSGEADSVIKLTGESGTVYYRLIKWGDTAEGLILLPDYSEAA